MLVAAPIFIAIGVGLMATGLIVHLLGRRRLTQRTEAS
jgi:hypothetical protein